MPLRNECSLTISSDGPTLLLNGSAVDTVFDTNGSAWFKSNDVADALGYSNSSRSVTHYIPPADKVAYSEISLHVDSPKITAHPRNIFISQIGLISFISERFPSCNAGTILNFSLSGKKSSSRMSRPDSCVLGKQRHVADDQLSKCNNHTNSGLSINGEPITLVVDANKRAWFRVSDVANALGYSSVTSVTQHVCDSDKALLKDLMIHEDSPAVNTLRNIFISQRGLADAVHIKRRKADPIEIRPIVPPHLNYCDELVLHAVYSCVKYIKSSSNNLASNAPPTPTSKATATPKKPEALMPFPQPFEPRIPSARKLSNAAANEDVDHSNDAILIMKAGKRLNSFSLGIVEDNSCITDSSICWKRRTISASKVLKLIEHLLSDRISADQTYCLPAERLIGFLSEICQKFEKSLKSINASTSRINLSKPNPVDLQPMNKDAIDSLTAASNSTGEWIYIASSLDYARKNAFKVGSTTDRLWKRLASYQTGRLQEDRYFYFQVFSVHNCKQIDKLIGFFLRRWCQYGDARQTEMYTLDFSTLSRLVGEIVNFYETAYRCALSL